ncbi:MAG: DUF6194 family protein [Planctomycetota bacterium]
MASEPMRMDEVRAYIEETFADLRPMDTWGEVSFFVNPGGRLKRGRYFCTIKERDGENDCASELDRPGVYRVNLGLTPGAYEAEFGPRPARPAKGGVVALDVDFTALDVPGPHPVYAWMGWVSVLNPSAGTFEKIKPWFDVAYRKACDGLQ